MGMAINSSGLGNSSGRGAAQSRQVDKVFEPRRMQLRAFDGELIDRVLAQNPELYQALGLNNLSRCCPNGWALELTEAWYPHGEYADCVKDISPDKRREYVKLRKAEDDILTKFVVLCSGTSTAELRIATQADVASAKGVRNLAIRQIFSSADAYIRMRNAVFEGVAALSPQQFPAEHLPLLREFIALQAQEIWPTLQQ